MKLRIQGNSLRFRLTRKEVDLLHQDGRVEATVDFAPGRALRYVVEAVPHLSELRARFEDTTISVNLPQTAADAWAKSSQVTIAGGGEDLGILIEKDFQCLHKPGDRDAGPPPCGRPRSLPACSSGRSGPSPRTTSPPRRADWATAPGASATACWTSTCARAHVRVRQRGDGTLVVAADVRRGLRPRAVRARRRPRPPAVPGAGRARRAAARHHRPAPRRARAAHRDGRARAAEGDVRPADPGLGRDRASSATCCGMLAGRGQVTPPSRDDLVGPVVAAPGAGRAGRRGAPTRSCGSRARSTWSGCTRTRRRPWSRASAASRSSVRGRPAWSRCTASAAPRRGWSATSGSSSWRGALWGRRVETYETAALLEPYGEWAGLASMHLLALSARTTVRRPVAARGGSRAAG